MSAAVAETDDDRRKALSKKLIANNKRLNELQNELDALWELEEVGDAEGDSFGFDDNKNALEFEKVMNEYNKLTEEKKKIVEQLLNLAPKKPAPKKPTGDVGGFRNFLQSNPTLKF